jgi:hypothetical protein
MAAYSLESPPLANLQHIGRRPGLACLAETFSDICFQKRKNETTNNAVPYIVYNIVNIHSTGTHKQQTLKK